MMLKRIPTEQVRVGMHVHLIEGSWLDHPFWRTSFPVRTTAERDELRASAMRHLWIDIARGIDVAPEELIGAADAAAMSQAMEADLIDAATAPMPLPDLAGLGDAMATATLPPPAREVRDHACRTVTRLFDEARMGRALDPELCMPAVQQIVDSVTRDTGTLIALLRLKDEESYTYLHSVAVCALMIGLARQLGFSPVAIRSAGLAGMLHDIGKSAIPLQILVKPERLSDHEFGIIRTHPEHGHKLLRDSGHLGEMALDVCLNHHEKMDGSGYPRGLAGTDVSLLARMGAVCDVYDAVTSDRPYKKGWQPGEALRRMAQWQGHFDPMVFQAFVRTVGIYPVGSLVRLRSGALAVVAGQHADNLLRPIVKVLRTPLHAGRLVHEVMDLAAPGCTERIGGLEPAEGAVHQRMRVLWDGTSM